MRLPTQNERRELDAQLSDGAFVSMHELTKQRCKHREGRVISNPCEVEKPLPRSMRRVVKEVSSWGRTAGANDRRAFLLRWHEEIAALDSAFNIEHIVLEATVESLLAEHNAVVELVELVKLLENYLMRITPKLRKRFSEALRDECTSGEDAANSYEALIGLSCTSSDDVLLMTTRLLRSGRLDAVRRVCPVLASRRFIHLWSEAMQDDASRLAAEEFVKALHELTEVPGLSVYFEGLLTYLCSLFRYPMVAPKG